MVIRVDDNGEALDFSPGLLDFGIVVFAPMGQ
jgi:hypothetical protein